MIYATVNMMVEDYESICDKRILLYRGDRNVEIRFIIRGNKFTVLDSTYAQLVIQRPSATSVISAPAPIQNNTVVLVVTGEMIDELHELGEYTFQIRLYDDTRTARATLPPCKGCLIIERPIEITGESTVNLAMVNDSAVMVSDTPEEETFTEDGKYNRTVWLDGDLITDTRLNKIEDALYAINDKGGGGGSTTAPYISTMLEENIMVGTGENFDLNLDFVSPNPGKGTLKVFINDVDSMSVKIDQGETTIPVSGELFNKGTNQVVVYVLDRVGVMSNSLTFYVRYGSTELSSTFDPYSSYDYRSTIRYYFTPVALDTSKPLTFYMTIDGAQQTPVNCTSDTRSYFTFPTNLQVGNHYCEAWVTDGDTKSNVLIFNLIILDNTSLVVASDVKSATIEEGAQLSLDYKVYMKNNSTFITKVFIDGDLVNTGTCGLDFNYFRTSSLLEGVHTIRLEVWDVTETHSDYVTWTVTVTPSTYEMLQPVNAGALFLATAINKTNSDERRTEFIGVDQEGNEVTGTLHNFAFNSESGWVDDELIISGNSHVEIPIQPLADNARYGFTLDLEFTSRQIGVEDAEVLTLWNDEKNCGIKITTEKLILRSTEGNECNLYYSDNERTSVIFIIDREERKAKIYLNGVMCEAFHLNDYTIDGVPYLEDFTVNSNLVLGGYNKNGYSKIRNLRIYQVALATDEIINNWISCEIDKAKQRELVEFQKGNDLPTMYIYCDFSGLGKDDKKPCNIVYNSTDPAKYGESFSLEHKQSTLQYQGTSSMAYPIKNYRINPVDENGKKWKYAFPGGQPESRFTLKADFMNSCHAHNTGMAKFINDNLYNYNLNDEKSMNPFKWHHIQNGGDVNDFREAINGFPCRLILVNDGETPLNEGQNEPTPGNTKDMGIFNFNNDKDNVTTLGFNSDIFPNCASYEVTANSDTSAGAFMSLYKDIPISKAGSYGTPTFPVSEFKSDFLTFESDGPLANLCRSYDNTGKLAYFNPNQGVNVAQKSIVTIAIGYTETDTPPTYLKINGITFNLKLMTTAEAPRSLDTIYEEDETKILDYLKQSFELRHPDSDDVSEDWGFMGVEAEVPQYTFDYHISSTHKATTYFSTTMFDSIKVVLLSETDWQVSYYDDSGAWKSNSDVMYSGDTLVVNKSYPYMCITDRSDGVDAKRSININGRDYLYGARLDENMIKEPYQTGTINAWSTEHGLKALIDWVDGCTDEEFVRDFEQHFHKDYTLRYYALVVLIGAVDNLGKNMMLDTADNKIFFPRFYDIDTILSYDNSGDIKFDVDIEMEQGYWNTSSSRLWTRVRDLFHDEIVATYNNMRQNGVSYENIMKYMYDEQIAKIPQTYYNRDYDVKYAPFEDSYVGMAHGNGYEHMKRWLKNRFIFCDTLFDYAPSYNNDVLTIRANTTELMNIEIETYTPVYQHVSWYNGQMDKKKIDGKVGTDFSGTAMAATDQEVLIYGGSNVKRIKGISSMNPNQMLIGSATKLVELDASDCPLLADINSNKANLSPHTYLNKVDLSNCPLLGGNLRLNSSPLIQEVDIRGTAITGLNLPSSIRNLEVLRLPNGITDINLNDAGMLHTLEFDEGVALNSVNMTNCNALENVIGLDLLQTPNITLDNSYNNVAELYFRDTTNLTVRNMPNLERVIYTPNNEYETFELINVANAPDYNITTYNCPKLSTFMTTAPYRESYNDCGMTTKSEPTGTLVYKDYSPNGAKFSNVVPFDYYNDVIEAEIDLTNCDADHLNENILSFAITDVALGVWGQDSAIHIYYTPSSKTLRFSYKGNTYSTDKIITDTIVNIKMDKGTIYLNNEIVLEGSIIESIFSPSTIIVIGSTEGSVRSTALYKLVGVNYGEIDREIKDYGDAQPNTTFTANSIDISSTQFTDVKLLCTTDTNTLKLPTTVKNFYCDSSFDLDTDYLDDGEYDVAHGELVEPYTTDYEGEVIIPLFKKTSISGSELIPNTALNGSGNTYYVTNSIASDYLEIIPETEVHSPNTFQCIGFYDENKQLVGTTQMWVTTMLAPINAKYTRFSFNITNMTVSNISVTYTTYSEYIPNLIPSSADGSLIFSMYAPEKTVAPASGTWDLKGLEFDNFHTFGMNNDIKASFVWRMKPYKLTTNAVVCAPIPIEFFKDGVDIYLMDDSGNTEGYYVYGFYKDGTESQNLRGQFYSTGSPKLYADDLLAIDNNTTHITIMNIYAIQGYYLYMNGEKYICPIGTETDLSTFGAPWREMVSVDSITMPARYEDYAITIKNANISPKTHNTMLYPLLVNEENPIEGKLDYTNYEGDYLSWSFAFTDLNKVNIEQPKDELLNTYKYRYNAFYQTDYEFDNPYEIARYTSSASGVFPSFNSKFTYTYDEIDNGDGTYTTKIYADSLDNLPTSYSFVANNDFLSVEKLDISNAVNLSYLFSSCLNLTSVNTSDWDTNKVTDMTNMFYNCKLLTTLDVSGWDTSKVTNMQSMFNGCSKLTTLDVSNWDTSQVTNMSSMFQNCKALTTLDVSGWDTSKVTTMQAMFQNCSLLTSLDVSEWDTSKVTSMSFAFSSCSSLTSLDVSGWDTSQVNTMYTMFQSCKALTTLDVSEWGTGNVKNMDGTFTNCSSLTSLDVSNWDTSQVTTMYGMFNGCSALTSLDVSNWDTSQVTTMYAMFSSCSKLTSLGVSGWDTSKVTTMQAMFQYCGSLTSLDLSEWDTSNVTSMRSMFYYDGKLESLDLSGWDTSKVTAMASMFSECRLLTSLDVSEWDTGKVTDMSYMFNYCMALTTLDLSTWNMGESTHMLAIFQSCTSLTSLNVIGWSSTNVNSMIPSLPSYNHTATLHGSVIIDESTLPAGWVYDNIMIVAIYTCNASARFPSVNPEFTYTSSEVDNGDGTYTTKIYADNLDNLPTRMNFNYTVATMGFSLLSVEKINTSKFITMYTMFVGCNNLTSVNTSGWDTSQVTNMERVFNGCSVLTSLDVSGFNTSNVTTMKGVFNGCSSLTSLDVSGWNTGKVTDMQEMFMDCKELREIIGIDKWDVGNVQYINYMFTRCAKLETWSLGDWDTRNIKEMAQTFRGTSISDNSGIEQWSVPSLLGLYFTFCDCQQLVNLDLSKWGQTILSENPFNLDATFYDSRSLKTVNLTNFNGLSIGRLNMTFTGCYALENIIGIGDLNVSQVTNMQSAFQNCRALTSLDLSEWDTSRVTTMQNMFTNCSSLTSLDLSEWDTGQVTEMYAMFQNCNSLTSIDVSEWDTGKLTSIRSIFDGCVELAQIIGIESWKVPSVNNISHMFKNCSSLTSLDLSKWRPNNPQMMYAFEGCTSLNYLNLANWGGAQVTLPVIPGCISLKTLDVSGWTLESIQQLIPFLIPLDHTATLHGSVMIDESTLPAGWVYDNALVVAIYTCNASGVLPTFNTEFTYTYDEIDNGVGTYTTKIYADSLDNLPTSISFYDNKNLLAVKKLNTCKVTQMDAMFQYCDNLTECNTAGWDTSQVTTMYAMFAFCRALTEIIGISTWDTGQVTNMQIMFTNCSKLTSLDTSKWDTSQVTNMESVFTGCSALTSLDTSDWDTSKVTNMAGMFENCSALTSLDVSGWDTNKVGQFQAMFQNCSALTSLDVSGWDTSNATYLNKIFSGCSNLTEIIGVESWSTGKSSLFTSTFRNCSSLTSLDLSEWSISGSYSIAEMFSGCSSLTSLDVSGWDTSNITLASSVFLNCSNLTEIIGISGWNMNRATNMNSMFSGCSSLTSLDLSGWGAIQATNMADMFRNCTSLTSVDMTGFNMASLSNAEGMFYNAKNLTEVKDIENWYCPKLRQVGSMFQGADKWTTCNFANWRAGEDTDGISSIYSFANNSGTTSIDISNWKINNGVNFANTFPRQLTNLKWSNWVADLGMSNLVNLTQASVVDLVANLANVTDGQTLILGATNLAKLTEDQIAIAVNKGWTIA